ALQADQVQAHIVASAPGVGGSVTGVAQGLASDVQLTVDSSDTVRLDSLRSAQADVTVGSGRLDITQVDVTQHGVFSTSAMTVILQPTTWTLDPSADVQLYSAGKPFALSLYGNHALTDALVPYRSPEHDGVAPTGRNRSLLENGLMQLQLSGHGVWLWPQTQPEDNARRLSDDPAPVSFSGMQLSMKDR